MEFVMIALLVMALTSSSGACSSRQTCSFSIDSCQAEDLAVRLAKAINITREVAQILKDSKQKDCVPHPEDCEAIYNCGTRSSDVYTVWPKSRILKTRTQVQVFCDMATDGGGWTVIQRRGDFGRPNDYFYKDWKSYKEGFGDITQDFWIGNDLLSAFTNQRPCTLRFDLRDLKGESRWATYNDFWIESEKYNYTLNVQGYRGNAGDSFLSFHNGRPFTTKDRDNDDVSFGNCAHWFKGAWWYSDCHLSNLNGLYLNGTHDSYADGVEWATWHGLHYSLPFTEMKIRSVFFKPRENQNDIPS